MKQPMMTDEELQEFRDKSLAASRLATEVKELRQDNARLRQLLTTILNVGEHVSDDFDKSYAVAEAARFLEDTAK